MPTENIIRVVLLTGGLLIGGFSGYVFSGLDKERLASCEAIADVDATDSQKLDMILQIVRSTAMEIIPPPNFRE